MLLLYGTFYGEDLAHVLITNESIVMTVHKAGGGGFTRADCSHAIPGVNYARVIGLTRYVTRLQAGEIRAEQVLGEMKAICDKTAGFPEWVALAAAGVASAGFGYLNAVPVGELVWILLAGMITFWTKGLLLKRGYNVYVAMLSAAFAGSFAGGWCIHLSGGSLQLVALIAPVLFLVPGIPTINGGIDIIRNRNAMSMVRLMHAGMMIMMLTCGTVLSSWLTPVVTEVTGSALPAGYLTEAAYKGLWAGAAALSLGVIMAAPVRTLPVYALLGFTIRFLRAMLLAQGVGIVAATFLAVCVVTVCSYGIAYRMKLPPIVFAVLPVLPEVPGMYAIRGLQDLYHFMTAEGAPSMELFLSANRYGGLALLIVFALITGILLPILVVDKRGPRFF